LTFFTPKKRKNWDFKSVENCSCPNWNDK